MNDPMHTPNSQVGRTNQNGAVPAEKRVQKVVKGPVKTKTNEIRKLADIFISEDIASVKSYIFMDVLVPAIKKAIYDIVTNGIDMFLYGGSGKGRASSNSSSNNSKISYRSYYDQKSSTPTPSYRGSENTVRSAADYVDIVFNTRGDAEAALHQMRDIVANYGIVTVNDLYEMTPLSPPFTAQNYGWMCDLNDASVERVRDGYILKLPKAMAIEK